MINSFNNHTTQPSFASDSSTFPTPSKFFYVALSLYCIILSTLLMLAFTAFIGFINLQYENHISWQLVGYALLVVGGHAAAFLMPTVSYMTRARKKWSHFSLVGLCLALGMLTMWQILWRWIAVQLKHLDCYKECVSDIVPWDQDIIVFGLVTGVLVLLTYFISRLYARA